MPPCPTDDVLGAHVEHALAATEAAAVSAHLDGCAVCREVVIAVVRGGISGAPTLAVGTPSLAPEPAKSGLAIGERVGRYEVHNLLGVGGMGQVYEAYDAELDRLIALKVIRPELAGASEVLADRLVRESRLMAKLVHPAVITVYDVGRAGDAVFIAMELIRGETLGTLVRRDKPSWRQIVTLLERAGQGLAAAHAAGIIHRDFKPENVLVEHDGQRVVVTDFGVSRAFAEHVESPAHALTLPSDPSLTAPGTTVGTPAYMAPEQIEGKSVDVRSDMFAFGVSGWEMLFGERPYAGRNVNEIRLAMSRSLRIPRGRGVPGRVVKVLVRALALDPAARYRDMPQLLKALAATRTRKRMVAAATAVTAIALVGAGIGSVRVFSSSPTDPCERGLASLDAVYNPSSVQALRVSLAGDPAATDEVIGRLDRAAALWRDTHKTMCRPEAEPAQPPAIATCLEARRLELSAIVDDVLLDGPKHAAKLSRLVGDPSACAWPAPGLLTARVPVDPVLRRLVTAVRYRAFDIEDARDRGEYRQAIAAATAIVADARPLWPSVHAEALYLLGTTQNHGGNSVEGVATLQEAATAATRSQDDYIAAMAWLALAQAASMDSGNAWRAIEYTDLAAAAIDRIGKRVDVAAMLDYTRAPALFATGHRKEGEQAVRNSVRLAEAGAPELLPLTIQGLGFMLETQGKYTEAVAAYRRALAALAKQRPAPSMELVFHERLSMSLDMLGETAEAEAEARHAVEIADRILDASNLDRPIAHANLAQVLQSSGKLDAALAEASRASADIAKIVGEHGSRFGEALSLEGSILADQEHFAEAQAKLSRGCEIIAFAAGEQSIAVAECWLSEISALSGVGKHAEALVLAEKTMAILLRSYGPAHLQVANAHVLRGALFGELGQHAKAIEDLERAREIFANDPIESGHLAGAEWALGKELWTTDRKRARSLVEQAVKHFDSANRSWALIRRDATAWLATHKI
jgi:tetratricopeptide (TPR) repeat protein/predicted Ser/Thr protein kinase